MFQFFSMQFRSDSKHLEKSDYMLMMFSNKQCFNTFFYFILV